MTRCLRRPWERVRVQIEFTEESLTEQSHKQDVDINNIIRRHARIGSLPPPSRAAYYGDVTRLQEPLEARMAFSSELLENVELELSRRQARIGPGAVTQGAAEPAAADAAVVKG